MTKYYSKTTRGFYASEIHDIMPDDAIEVSDSVYDELFRNQSLGMEIVPDENGRPINIIPNQIKTIEDLSNVIKNNIQSNLDGVAKSWGYDSMDRAATYLFSSNIKYKTDAETLLSWRDSVWSWAETLFTKIKIGDSADNLMKKMPKPPERIT